MKFKTFLKSNGITHKTGAPYHPATNPHDSETEMVRSDNINEDLARGEKSQTQVRRSTRTPQLPIRYRGSPNYYFN